MEKLAPNEDNEVIVIPVSGEALGENSDEVLYEKFFEDISKTDNRIKFTNTAKIFKSLKCLKKTYFPGAWMPEHHESVTHPRQFIANNPEAGGIYAKMIYVHALINNQLRGDKTRKRTALEELWKAQDSRIFCPGSPSSPGLLHPPVRKAAYKALLEAEKITREKGKFSPSLSFFDFDLDGEGEYIFQDDKLNCCVKARGAGIFELDYLPSSWNYLDTMAPTVIKQNALGTSSMGKRCAFVDWLAPPETLPADITPDGIRGGRFCGEEEYEVAETDRLRRKVVFRLAPKAGALWAEIEIGKTWQLRKNSLVLEYVLKNTGTQNSAFIFSPSIDLSFPGFGKGFLKLLVLMESEKEEITPADAYNIQNIRALEFHDLKNETVITLEVNRNFDALIFQVKSGFPGMEECQSTCTMPLLPVSLDGGKTWKVTFSLRLGT